MFEVLVFNHSGIRCLEKILFSSGELAQMVERSLSMREAAGSMPAFSTFYIFPYVSSMSPFV